MNKIAIIIPSRLAAERLPNKPLKLINNKEMILHVYDTAIKAQIGEVYVATPDQAIYELLKKHGGKAIKTQKNYQTGTDRIFEVFEKELKKKTDLIVNLQGDMPNLNPSGIINLVKHMEKKTCDIGTLASKFV
jgi:3-deoxy-manno-octulosonate cytidylyltransferase (CMP-KDO synthetase)